MFNLNREDSYLVRRAHEDLDYCLEQLELMKEDLIGLENINSEEDIPKGILTKIKNTLNRFSGTETSIEALKVKNNKLQRILEEVSSLKIDNKAYSEIEVYNVPHANGLINMVPVYTKVDKFFSGSPYWNSIKAPVQKSNMLDPKLNDLVQSFISAGWDQVRDIRDIENAGRACNFSPSSIQESQTESVKKLGYNQMKSLMLAEKYVQLNGPSIWRVYLNNLKFTPAMYAVVVKTLFPNTQDEVSRTIAMNARYSRLYTIMYLGIALNFSLRMRDCRAIITLLQAMKQAAISPSGESFVPASFNLFSVDDPERIIVDDTIIPRDSEKINITDDNFIETSDDLVDDLEALVEDGQEQLLMRQASIAKGDPYEASILHAISGEIYLKNRQCIRKYMQVQEPMYNRMQNIYHTQKTINVLLERELDRIFRTNQHVKNAAEVKIKFPNFRIMNGRFHVYQNATKIHQYSLANLLVPVDKNDPLGELTSLLSSMESSGFSMRSHEYCNKPTISQVFTIDDVGLEKEQSMKDLGYSFNDFERFVKLILNLTEKNSFESTIRNGNDIAPNKIVQTICQGHIEDNCNGFESAKIRRTRYSLLSAIRMDVLGDALLYDSVKLYNVLRSIQ
jgi:hypothetical protein